MRSSCNRTTPSLFLLLFSSFSPAFFCAARDPTPPTSAPLSLSLSLTFLFLVASCLQSGANIFLVNRPLLDRYSWLPLCASRTSRGLPLCRRQCRARTHARMHARRHETSYPTSQPASHPARHIHVYFYEIIVSNDNTPG